MLFKKIIVLYKQDDKYKSDLFEQRLLNINSNGQCSLRERANKAI